MVNSISIIRQFPERDNMLFDWQGMGKQTGTRRGRVPVCCCKSILAWLACGAATLAALRFGFTFAASLRTFVVGTPTSLGQDAILLHFTVEPFQRKLKRVTWVNFDFTHRRLPA
jgi:hypothetical protein